MSAHTNYANVAAAYGYGVIREGGNTVLAVQARSVSKIRGLLLVVFSGIAGVFFLLIAITSRHDRILATAIFLFCLICIVGSLYLIKKKIVRTIAFTPTVLLVDGDGIESRSFDLAQIESFSSYRETLTVRYGTESVKVLRRVPNAGQIQTQAERLLEEYKRPAS